MGQKYRIERREAYVIVKVATSTESENQIFDKEDNIFYHNIFDGSLFTDADAALEFLEGDLSENRGLTLAPAVTNFNIVHERETV